MGCDPTHNAGFECPSYELPLHAVELDAYWIDKFETTNAKYSGCVEAKVCEPPQDISSYTRSDYYANPTYANYPVINVVWEQANQFCARAGKRLPT